MAHVDSMLKRLHPLYREGDLLRQVVGVPAVQLEIADEDMRLIQQSHWFNQCLERDEAARLGALLDIDIEDWQNLDTYRVWFNSLRDSLIGLGASTVPALQNFVAEYLTGYQQTVGTSFMPTVTLRKASDIVWSSSYSVDAPSFVENPPIRRFQRATSPGGIEPLQQFQIVNKGLDDSEASFLLVGLETRRESVPVIVNLNTGEALIYDGSIGAGQRLWINPDGAGGVHATLELQDVSAKIRSVAGLVPGTPWAATQISSPAKPITVPRGTNDFWYLPVAHYNDPGLDSVLLSLPDLTLTDGRYDKAGFDQAIFYLEPAVILTASWLENQPATIDIALPGGLMYSPAPPSADPSAVAADLQRRAGERDLLETSLNEGVNRLRAAGVVAAVELAPFSERQGANEYLTSIQPVVVRERAPMGVDALVNKGGLFGVTNFDDSTFR